MQLFDKQLIIQRTTYLMSNKEKKYMQAITIQSVSKKFPTGKLAVDHVTINIEEGEIFGFLGPNGAGKTTSIKLFTGLLQPTTGSCSIYGIDATLHPDQVHQISGVVTEHSQMYDHLSGLDNLVFYATLFGASKEDGEKQALELLAKLELSDAKNQKLGTYSTGMRQRLSLARALIHHPKVLFLDEPTSGLDPESIVSVNQMIQDLAKQNDVTIFLCTHQLRYAQELCTSYGLIDGGRLFAVGDLETLRNQVQNGLSVLIQTNKMPMDIDATYVGDMNYQCSVASKDEIPAMIKKIVDQGGNIYEVNIQELSLEEIYFSLLKKDRQERGVHHG